MIETILKYYKPPFKVKNHDDMFIGIVDSDGKDILDICGYYNDDTYEKEKAIAKELCYLLNLAAANQISDNHD